MVDLDSFQCTYHTHPGLCRRICLPRISDLHKPERKYGMTFSQTLTTTSIVQKTLLSVESPVNVVLTNWVHWNGTLGLNKNLTESTHFKRIFVLSTKTAPWGGFSSLSFIRIIGQLDKSLPQYDTGCCFLYVPFHFQNQKGRLCPAKRTFFKLRISLMLVGCRLVSFSIIKMGRYCGNTLQ